MYECACVYLDPPDEIAAAGHVELRTARKVHRCVECGRDIHPGEQYEHSTGLFDDQWETHKTCADCLSIRDTFFCDGFYYEMTHEHMIYHIHDCLGQLSETQIAKLTPAARAWVCEQIEEIWEMEGNHAEETRGPERQRNQAAAAADKVA